MKEIAVIFTIVFCFGLLAEAQERSGFGLFRKKSGEYNSNYQTANWGDINKKGGKELANVIVAQDNNQFYTWSGYNGYYYEPEPILRAFSHEGRLKLSASLEGEFVQFIHFNNRLLYVFLVELENNQVTINMQEINKADGTFTGIRSQLFTTEKAKRIPFNTTLLRHAVSPDHKRLVITLLSNKETKAEAPDQISIIAFDERLKESWKLEDRQFSEQSFHLLDMVMDDAGTVYLATQLYNDAQSITEGHKVVLQTIDEQGKRIRPLSLEYWGITIVDFVMKIDKGRVLGTGLYNSTAHYSRVKGVLLLELDSYHNEYQRLYTEDFPVTIIAEFMEKKKVDAIKELGQIYLNDVILADDGSVTLVVQEGNRVPLYGRYPTARLTVMDDTSPEPHSYGNLLVSKFTSSGKLLYTKVIKKKLTTSFTQQRMGAYSAFNFNGATYIFYYKGRFPSKSNPIIKTRISDRGTVTSDKFLRSKDPGLFICPRFFQKSVKDDSLILYGQMTSKYRFGKIKIK